MASYTTKINYLNERIYRIYYSYVAMHEIRQSLYTLEDQLWSSRTIIGALDA